jgi:hypothetical protein
LASKNLFPAPVAYWLLPIGSCLPVAYCLLAIAYRHWLLFACCLGAVTPSLADPPAREGLLELQCSARRAAPRQLRSNKTFHCLLSIASTIGYCLLPIGSYLPVACCLLPIILLAIAYLQSLHLLFRRLCSQKLLGMQVLQSPFRRCFARSGPYRSPCTGSSGAAASDELIWGYTSRPAPVCGANNQGNTSQPGNLAPAPPPQSYLALLLVFRFRIRVLIRLSVDRPNSPSAARR